jgi:hypothetical protein
LLAAASKGPALFRLAFAEYVLAASEIRTAVFKPASVFHQLYGNELVSPEYAGDNTDVGLLTGS